MRLNKRLVVACPGHASLSWELIDREKTITLEDVPDRRITLTAMQLRLRLMA